MQRRSVLLAAVALVAAAGLALPQGLAQTAPAVSKFLAPGELDPALILPPPSRVGSPAEAAERAELHRLAAERTPERLAQARRDDEVENVSAFAGVLAPAFDLKALPATARLFADLRYEDGVAARAAKAYFHRDRPFQAEPALDVCDDGHDKANTYPSGHSTMGFAAAAVLANLIPGKAQPVLARASDYAESRLYCGVHYRSDTTAAMTLGNVLAAKLMAKPAFAAELEAARAELTRARIAP